MGPPNSTVAERDALRSRIAQLEHDEKQAKRYYPHSAFRGPRQAELSELRLALRLALRQGLKRVYNGESGGKS